MKTIFILIALLISGGISSATELEFELKNGKPTLTKGDLNAVELPLTIKFTKDFDGKKITLIDLQNKPVSSKISQFGVNSFDRDGDSGGFILIIGENGRINPGDETAPLEGIKIDLDKTIFTIPFQKKSNNNSSSGSSAAPGNQAQEIPVKYKSGYIYYDAVAISNALKATPIDRVKITAILADYQINGKNWQTNKFLYSQLPNDLYNAVQAGVFGSLLGNIGSKDVTTTFAGVSQFLAERFKEEINEAFFVKMKKELNAYPELKTIFPESAARLLQIESYNYAAVLQVLKEAFQTDVDNLASNLYNIQLLTKTDCDNELLSQTKLSSCQDRIQKLNQFFEKRKGLWSKLGLFALKELSESSNPPSMLASIANASELTQLKAKCIADKKRDEYNVCAAIELTNLLSHSFISRSGEQSWIDPSEFKALLDDSRTLKIYLGLLYAYQNTRPSKINFMTDSKSGALENFGERLNNLQPKFNEYEQELTSLIKNLYNAFNAGNNAVRKISASTSSSNQSVAKDLYDYYKTFSTSISLVANNSLLVKLQLTEVSKKTALIRQYLDPSVDLAYHISSQKYSSALYDALSITKEIWGEDEDRPLVRSMIKYGTVITSIAAANGSDEVKKALEASVLPVGSASIKRNTDWSISLNAYVGAYWGKVHTTVVDSVSGPTAGSKIGVRSNTSYSSFGLYAPIGLSLNKGSRSGWGVSLTAQLVDIGALVNFYLRNGNETALPEDFKVRLSNIFAPGGQLAVNFPGIPVSLSYGIQYVPALYKIDQISAGSQIVANPAWRSHVSLIVDIPLYNLKVWDFSKSKRKAKRQGDQ